VIQLLAWRCGEECDKGQVVASGLIRVARSVESEKCVGLEERTAGKIVDKI
jgi:hypothetical protein